METLLEPSVNAANQMPFSENTSAFTGAPRSNVAANDPDFTSKTLIWPSVLPAASRWPSGWNLAQVRAASVVSRQVFGEAGMN